MIFLNPRGPLGLPTLPFLKAGFGLLDTALAESDQCTSLPRPRKISAGFQLSNETIEAARHMMDDLKA